MAILIGLEHVSHEWPGKVVLSDQTIGINEGDRIGVVGRNGDGKSTLLEIVAQGVEPDDGRVIWRNGIHVGMLAQSDAFSDDETVGHAVVGDTPEYVWASDPRIRGIVDELIGDLDWEGRVGDLSGGQRRRVDLARVLAGDWDVLLMDEPTNHLDMGAIRWLADHLRRRWPAGTGALILVTHDRWFLDEVCEHMWEVHDGVIDPFEGGYSAYVQQRVERQRQEAVMEERRQNVLRRELNWLAHGAKARSSKPKFRIDAAMALLADDPPVRNSLELRRLAVGRLGKQVIELKNVSVAYGDAKVLDGISWTVGPGDRVGILGENGAGKSTLLRVMCARQRPSAGYVKIGKTVRFAIMSQQLEGLSAHDDERMEDLLSTFHSSYVIDGKSYSPTQLAEQLGFARSELPTFIKDLSGGQRRRLALLWVLLQQPNVLVLDEPGNDLDTDMLAKVESLLDEWPGTLLLVTHDRWLMERVTDDQYALIGGKLRHCPRGVDQFFELVEEAHCQEERVTSNSSDAAADTAGAAHNEQSDAGTVSDSDSGLSNKERREYKKRFDAVQRRLEKLREEPGRLDRELAQHDPTDYQGLLDIQNEKAAVDSEIASLEDEWLELADLLGIE